MRSRVSAVRRADRWALLDPRWIEVKAGIFVDRREIAARTSHPEQMQRVE